MSWREIVELYSIHDGHTALNLKPRYNVAPTQEVHVCRLLESGEPKIIPLRWGLIPFWAKDMKIGYKLINARSETVHEKPSFRAAFKTRRCLIPSSGWYEWTKDADGGKQPHFISLPGNCYSFAGLWETWDKGPDGPVESFTIITTEASPSISSIHNRMPVIVPEHQYADWLDPETASSDLKEVLAAPIASGFIHQKVSRDVNKAGADRPEFIDAIE